MVDRQRVPTPRDLDDLGHAFVALLTLERGLRDRGRHRVVLGARDDQQRPPVRVLALDLRLGPRVQVRGGGLEDRLTGGRHAVRVVELLRLVGVDRVREGIAELLEGQRHRTMPIRGVAQHGRGRLQRRNRQRQDAPERRRVDGHGRRRGAAARHDLCEQASERVTDDRGLPVELADHVLEMIGHFPDGLPREHLGVGLRLRHRRRIVGPAGREGRVPRRLEHLGPAIPATGQQPESVDEHHRCLSGGVRSIDLRALVFADARHDPPLLVGRRRPDSRPLRSH